MYFSVLSAAPVLSQTGLPTGWARWRGAAGGAWTLDFGWVPCGSGLEIGPKNLGIQAELGAEGTRRLALDFGVRTAVDWHLFSGLRWGPHRLVSWRCGAVSDGRGWGQLEFPVLQPPGAPLKVSWQAGIREAVGPHSDWIAVLEGRGGGRPVLRVRVRWKAGWVGAGGGGVRWVRAWTTAFGDVRLTLGWMRRQIPWSGVEWGTLDPRWGGDGPLSALWMSDSR